MIVIPVLDLQNGLAVAAMGGERKKSQPLKSIFDPSPDPVALVQSIIKHTGLQTFYIADLNAITGNGSNQHVINEIINRTSANLWLDRGVVIAAELKSNNRITTIAATETFKDWTTVKNLSKEIVSIDIKNGKLISTESHLTIDSVLKVSRQAGAKKFLHLRLDAVGGKRFNPKGLIKPIKGEDWYSGGGVASQSDLKILDQSGYLGALVGSSFHSGELTI